MNKPILFLYSNHSSNSGYTSLLPYVTKYYALSFLYSLVIPLNNSSKPSK